MAWARTESIPGEPVPRSRRWRLGWMIVCFLRFYWSSGEKCQAVRTGASQPSEGLLTKTVVAVCQDQRPTASETLYHCMPSACRQEAHLRRSNVGYWPTKRAPSPHKKLTDLWVPRIPSVASDQHFDTRRRTV